MFRQARYARLKGKLTVISLKYSTLHDVTTSPGAIAQIGYAMEALSWSMATTNEAIATAKIAPANMDGSADSALTKGVLRLKFEHSQGTESAVARILT